MYLLTSREGREPADLHFRNEVRRRSRQPVELCFQCQRCTNGCPVADFVQVTPGTIVRLVQLGFAQRALRADLIWLCPACETCAVRCPNGISVRRIIDVLQGLAVSAGVVPLNHKELVFHHLFLAGVAGRGRVAELPLLLRYKAATREIFRDLGLGWQLLRRGKLPLKTCGVKNRAEIQRLFRTIAVGAGVSGEPVENPYLFRATASARPGW